MEFTTLNLDSSGILGLPCPNDITSNDDNYAANYDQLSFDNDLLMDQLLESTKDNINNTNLPGPVDNGMCDTRLPFADLEDIQEVLNEDENTEDNTQDFIDEMETFLRHHEENMNINVDEESAKAEQVLDALINGQIEEQPPITASESPLHDITALSSASNITHVSEFTMADGRNAIIIIAGPNATANSPGATSSVLSTEDEDVNIEVGSNPTSPSTSSIVSSDDADWTLEPKRGRVTKPRQAPSTSGRVTKKSKHFIQDKKERKKWQNVEAARRYRDKKKQEAEEHELECKMLEDKNKSLKEKTRDMENEIKTLKKLLTDLGLVKVA